MTLCSIMQLHSLNRDVSTYMSHTLIVSLMYKWLYFCIVLDTVVCCMVCLKVRPEVRQHLEVLQVSLGEIKLGQVPKMLNFICSVQTLFTLLFKGLSIS